MSSLKEIVQSTTGETREVLENLVRSLADSKKENHRLEQRIKTMGHDNRLLRKRLFGASSEKKTDELYDQSELGLFDDFEICASQVDPEELELPEQKIVPAPKKPAGRKPLPTNLPRKIVEHDLPGVSFKLCKQPQLPQIILRSIYDGIAIKIIQHIFKKN